MTRNCPTCAVTQPGTHCFACGNLVPAEPKFSDQHAVFATFEDGTKVRVSDWMTNPEALDRWTAMDDQRREALRAKGLVAWKGQPIRHYEVRSAADPAYNGLVQVNLVRGFQVLTRTYATDTYAAKAVLKPLGFVGKAGGYIYEGKNGDGSDCLVGQGWYRVANMVGHRILRLTGETGYRAVATTSLLVRKEA